MTLKEVKDWFWPAGLVMVAVVVVVGFLLLRFIVPLLIGRNGRDGDER